MFLKRCCVVLMLLCIPAMARAASLADQVPDDAVLYISWSGSENLGPDYANSHMAAIARDSGLPKTFTEMLPNLLNTIGQKEPHAAEALKLLADLVPVLWKYPSAIYFGGLQAPQEGSPEPTIGLAIICDAGDDADQLINQIRQIAGDYRAPLDISKRGSLVIFSATKALPIPAKPLSASPQFIKAMSLTSKNPVVVSYLNVDLLITQVNRAMPLSGPGNGRRWNAIRDQLALADIHQITCTAGFEDKNWVSHTFIAAPTHDKGLPAILAGGKPITDEDLALIPVSATVATIGNLDLAGIYDQIAECFTLSGPRASDGFKQVIGIANQFSGIDLRQDLLGSLGHRWTIYIDPKSTGSSLLLSSVMINSSIDAPKADAALTTAITNLGRMASGAMRNQFRVHIRSGPAKETTIHTVPLMFVSPSWAARDGKMYFSLFPQTLTSALAAPQSSLKDNPKFIAARQKLGVKESISLTYVDSEDRLPLTYGNQLLMSQYLLGGMDMFGGEIPWNLLPPLSQIMPELEPAISGCWIDADGIHYKTVEPFPLSTSMTMSEAQIGALAPAALAASILLPTLSSAREQANRIKCAANMRQIGTGLMLYSAENKDRLPDTLDEIILRGDLTPNVFVCPSGNSPQPSAGLAQDPQALSQWMKDNCSYVYLGAGQKMGTLGPDMVMVYELESDHDFRGMNLLFGDGHVEWQSLPEAHKAIETTKTQLGIKE